MPSVSQTLKSIKQSPIRNSTFIGIVIYILYVLNYQEADAFLDIKIQDFKYQVMCPVDSNPIVRALASQFGLRQESLQNTQNLFVVVAIARNKSVSGYDTKTNSYVNKTTTGLYYCGFARAWNGTCRDAQFICSSPGPMFYVPVIQDVTIIWINNISSDGIIWQKTDCYSPYSNDMECTVDSKINNSSNPDAQSCTFFSPTNFSAKSDKYRVGSSQIPMAPHIHGLEVRPVFDGNPYSWFTKSGNKGVGYFSLNQQKYFRQFKYEDKMYKNGYISKNNRFNSKIIKFTTNKLPGMLFYHDHAMKSTKYNVAHGLSGLFIIYDPDVQQQLPQKSQVQFILFSMANDGDLRKNPAPPQLGSNYYDQRDYSYSYDNQNHDNYMRQRYYQENIYILNDDTYFRNMTYRFRFLDGHFDNLYQNISFVVYYNTITLPNGTTIIKQIDPFQKDYDLTISANKINFTVIGTDSTLFDYPVHNRRQFTLGSGQRIDTLIKFGPAEGVPLEVKNFYLICFDRNFGDFAIKKKFTMNQIKQLNKYYDPIATRPLDVKFTDLTKVPLSKIVKNRMRMLGSLPGDVKFSINNHYMFHDGRSQNCQIGTIQDFYIINPLFEAHPIHVHLINYQIVQTYDLKKTPYGCTVYQLDNYRFSNYPKIKNLTDEQLCEFITTISVQQANNFYQFMSNYSLQTQFKATNIGQVSGLNVMEPIITKQQSDQYSQYPKCQYNTLYKYICRNTTKLIKPEYKRWKQTALVKEYTVMVLRIRWASTAYDPKIRSYPYFDIPQEHLIQFPGFVYHCHILPHEDNQMMRPIMLQHSEQYKRRNSQNDYGPYSNSNNLRNEQNNNLTKIKGWYQKFKEINSALGCLI